MNKVQAIIYNAKRRSVTISRQNNAHTYRVSEHRSNKLAAQINAITVLVGVICARPSGWTWYRH